MLLYSPSNLSHAGNRRRENMVYYQQTLLIPKPTQNLPRDNRGCRGRAQARRAENRNEGINSILAYFD